MSRIDSLIAKRDTVKDIAARMDVLNDIAGAYNSLGYANDKALESAQEALIIAEKQNKVAGQVYAFLNIGTYFQLKGDAKQCLDYFLKAQDIAEKNNGKDILAEVYDRLSQFYRSIMRNVKRALEYSQKELMIRKESNNKNGYAAALANMGNIYYDMDSTRRALQYYIEAADFFTATKAKNNLADVENNIGSAYNDLKEYGRSIEYYEKALSSYQELNNKYGVAMCYGNIGNVYDMKGEMEKGVAYSEQALQMAREINAKDMVAAAYTFLAEGYSKLGDYKKAFDYQAGLVNINDTIFNETSTKQINDMQVKYDTEKKEKENKILELSVNKQKIINYSILAGLLLVIALAFFIFRGYRDKQKANEALAEKNKIIEEINKDIIDSINYAKRIQHAILTSDEYLAETLGEHFVLYKPRDVVSGDFYWCYSNYNKVVFTVADCTGHGVPGALMSMIGNSLLNETVIENKITDAAQILNALRNNIVKTLQQKGQSFITRDGMDIALCVWDKEKKEIQYAGANNSLYLYRNNADGLESNKKLKLYGSSLYEVLPDKQPIGYMEDKMDKSFSSYTMQLKKGDIIYIATDGYADQFGGEANKKFTKKKFRELLASIAEKPLPEQKEIMDRIIEQWKNTTTQTDDICLLGVKIS
ncbi:MAG TPA: tetratricopeptide repeat protein [Bacteroidia bacterium]|nr:tetratricopeptide repeat protein [Bacteroidia bacterium]